MEARSGNPLQVTGLVAGYGDKPVLDGVDLELEPGGKILLLGPNGAGKTTLLRTVLGLLRPSSGQVRLWGDDPADPSRRPALMARLGLSLEPPRSMMRATAADWLLLHARLAGLGQTDAQHWLDDWGLPGERLLDDLSQGERQKLETIRTLLHRPRLLVLDEPTAHLDPGERDRFWNRLDRWCQTHEAAMLATTHHLEEASDRGGDWVVLGHGRILHRGASDDFLARFACSRRLALATAVPTATLAHWLTPILEPGTLVATADPRVHRIHPPRGRQDLPQLARLLVEQGAEIVFLGEDSTSFREAYATCLASPVRLAAPPLSPDSAVPAPLASPWTVVSAAFRAHLGSLSRERRLLIPFFAMLLVVTLAAILIPAESLSASILGLGAVLPCGMAGALAADLVAGERERHSLETSVSLPVGFGFLLAGRTIAIALPALVLSWLGVTLLGAASGANLVSCLAVGALVSPAAIVFSLSVGVRLSLRSQSTRTAVQLSTLSSLPLLALGQAVPLLFSGHILPWGALAALLGLSTIPMLIGLPARLRVERLFP